MSLRSLHVSEELTCLSGAYMSLRSLHVYASMYASL